MTPNRFEKHSKKIMAAIIGVGLIVAVFAAEKFLAKTQPAPIEGAKRHIRLREHPPGTVRMVPPPEKALKSGNLEDKPYRLEIDRDGFVFPSRFHDQADLTVVFLGGSTTECLYVDEETRFPFLVGRLLDAPGRKVNTFNGGVSGSNVLHSIDILLNKVIPLDPEVVVLMHNINDLGTLLFEGTYWNRNPSRSLLIWENPGGFRTSAKMALKSIVPNLYDRIKRAYYGLRAMRGTDLTDEWAHVRGRKLTIDRERLLTEFDASLQIFIDICRTKGISPVLMTQAGRFTKPTDSYLIETWTLEEDFGITLADYREIFLAFNAVIREVGVRNDVPVIELANHVTQTGEYLYDEVHLNNEGCHAVAVFIARTLETSVLTTE